jgi:hypothetical protein
MYFKFTAIPLKNFAAFMPQVFLYPVGKFPSIEFSLFPQDIDQIELGTVLCNIDKDKPIVV